MTNSVTAAMRLTAVTKRYAEATALSGIDLDVPVGQTTGLIGVNGAGKSTLIKCALDLLAVTSGRIEIFGRDHRRARAREPLAYLSERFTPPHYATGEELLRFLCGLHGAPYEPQRAVAECTDLELDPAVLGQRVRDYSKGMAQKLGLIACLLSRRRFLLLDEPMSGLDPKAHALFRQRLLRLKADGVTLFFSTHALGDVALLCDRVVVIHAGSLRYTGSTAELLVSQQTGSLDEAFLRLIASPPA